MEYISWNILANRICLVILILNKILLAFESKIATMTLFLYHEVKVVLINYLYPGTFVKQKNKRL
jgi:hypothetical protein